MLALQLLGDGRLCSSLSHDCSDMCTSVHGLERHVGLRDFGVLRSMPKCMLIEHL